MLLASPWSFGRPRSASALNSDACAKRSILAAKLGCVPDWIAFKTSCSSASVKSREPRLRWSRFPRLGIALGWTGCCAKLYNKTFYQKYCTLSWVTIRKCTMGLCSTLLSWICRQNIMLETMTVDSQMSAIESHVFASRWLYTARM